MHHKGFDDLVKTLLHPPVPQKDSIDLVELFIACIEGHISIVESLLEAGANRDLRDLFGWTRRSMLRLGVTLKWQTYFPRSRLPFLFITLH